MNLVEFWSSEGAKTGRPPADALVAQTQGELNVFMNFAALVAVGF